MTTCNALFCVAETHDGDLHVDATGHTWTEPTPEAEVIAHVLRFDEAHNEAISTWPEIGEKHDHDTFLADHFALIVVKP